MKTNLWWKWLLVAVLVLASIVFTYPMNDWVDEEGKTHLGKIRLGLDLKGGYSFTVSLDEEDLRHNGSYPSGHTILGWSAALLLTEMAPDMADTVLARGYMYGQSRVIAGFHWQSDVDAGRLCASAAVARLHADKRFMKLMKKAKKEYQKLSKKK